MEEKVSLALQAGRNLKIIIKNNRITQAEAAEKINVAERTLRRYLQQGIDSLDTLSKICDVFNIGIETILKKD